MIKEEFQISGEKMDSSTNWAVLTGGGKKAGSMPHVYIRINSEWIKGLKVKYGSMKVWEEFMNE